MSQSSRSADLQRGFAVFCWLFLAVISPRRVEKGEGFRGQRQARGCIFAAFISEISKAGGSSAGAWAPFRHFAFSEAS
jgi:hypothetical protein